MNRHHCCCQLSYYYYYYYYCYYCYYYYYYCPRHGANASAVCGEWSNQMQRRAKKEMQHAVRSQGERP